MQTSMELPSEDELLRADAFAARIRGADYAGRKYDLLTELAFAYQDVRTITRNSRSRSPLTENEIAWEVGAYLTFMELYAGY